MTDWAKINENEGRLASISYRMAGLLRAIADRGAGGEIYAHTVATAKELADEHDAIHAEREMLVADLVREVA